MAFPGAIVDPGADSSENADRFQAVRAVTLHRTQGGNAGDYSAGKYRHHETPGTFNYLVQTDGDVYEFYPPEVRCSHAAGANKSGPGVEFTGNDGSPLTAEQVESGGELLRWLAATYKVPAVLYAGPRVWVDESSYRGFINHEQVAYPPKTSYQHFDNVTADEFARMMQVVPDKEYAMGVVTIDGKTYYLFDGSKPAGARFRRLEDPYESGGNKDKALYLSAASYAWLNGGESVADFIKAKLDRMFPRRATR